MHKRDILQKLEIIRETAPFSMADVFAARMDQIDLLLKNAETLKINPQSHNYNMLLRADKAVSSDFLAHSSKKPSLWTISNPPLSIELCDIVIRNILNKL